MLDNLTVNNSQRVLLNDENIIPNETTSSFADLISSNSLPEKSTYRQTFQTTEQMKIKFLQFLRTIFYQLDEKKVFSLMEKILNDLYKSDEQIYKELLGQIHSTKKNFPILSKIWSLLVLKKGMGRQAAQLMRDFSPKQFHNYLEIYDRRYIKTIRKAIGAPLNGKIIAVANSPEVKLSDRIQAGALFSSYPYHQHEDLNDKDCSDPFLFPEKTHKPISNQVEDNSVDMIACLGGFHHIPPSRLDAFVDSLHKKLRPGGVILVRDHNVTETGGLTKEELKTIAAVVHSFVNAADEVPLEVEAKEVREFKSVQDWTKMMERHGFKRISKEELVLPEDPTENAMFAFVKSPTCLEELKQAVAYRNDCTRPKEGTRATWIEWGNVRFSKQYAEYIQKHHAYSFDFVGHLRQHWKHFFYFVQESLNDKEISLKDLVLSDNMAMNLFILTMATAQCTAGSILNFPASLVARWKYGKEWRNVANLSELEKFQARNEDEYSKFIDHTPFYMYDYIGKMKEMFNVIKGSHESFGTKLTSTLSAVSSGIKFVASACISAPVKALYTIESYQEPDSIKMVIKDPSGELETVITQWEQDKDLQHDKDKKISIIYETLEGYKLVSLPRYRPFTKICEYLSQTKDLEILEIGSQKEISVDVLLKSGIRAPQVEGARVIYELEKLQDEEKRRYATYQVNVSALKQFERALGSKNIEYIHE